MPLKFNPTTGKLDMIGSSTGGVTTFTNLSDAPSSYSGQAGKAVSVKSDESGLEFSDLTSGGDIDGGSFFDTYINTADVDGGTFI